MAARPRPSARATAIFASLPGLAAAAVVKGKADVRSLMEISFEASVAARPHRQSGRRAFRRLLARVKFCKDANNHPPAHCSLARQSVIWCYQQSLTGMLGLSLRIEP